MLAVDGRVVGWLMLALLAGCGDASLRQPASQPAAQPQDAAAPSPAAPVTPSGAPQPGAAGQKAVVRGTVVYRADPKRRWRYSRYYVRDRRRGLLAEAVVALHSKSLPSGPPAKRQTTVIDQKNFQFVPETVAIRAGDTVKFTNSDNDSHNVRTAGPLARFNQTMPRGGSFEHVFDQAGGARSPARIGCAFHGAMRAWVFVFDHPFFQLTGSDGQFRFDDVPPGRYELRMIHPAGQLQWSRPVELRGGRPLEIAVEVSPDHLTTD